MPHSEDLILKRFRDEVGLPKSTSKRIVKKLEALAQSVAWATPLQTKKRLPNERTSITHQFSVAGHEGVLTVGMYEDGSPGELLVVLAKEGSTLAGLLDGFSTVFSIALQYGVPLRAMVDKMVNTRFDPSGYTGNPQIRYAKSLLDYIGRYLGGKFISSDYFDSDSSHSAPPPKQPAHTKAKSRKSSRKAPRRNKGVTRK